MYSGKKGRCPSVIDIKLDNVGNPEDLTLVLSTRNMTHLGQLNCLDSVRLVKNLNSADELSFTVYKEVDGVQANLWDEILDFKLVYVKELDEYFEITLALDDTREKNVTKSVTCTSLCEAELSQTNIYNVEINTEDDIARDQYYKALLTSSQKCLATATTVEFVDCDTDEESFENSILGRILSFVPQYKLRYVDESLIKSKHVPQFSVDGTSVYDFLTGDLADEYNCLFMFD